MGILYACSSTIYEQYIPGTVQAILKKVGITWEKLLSEERCGKKSSISLEKSHSEDDSILKIKKLKPALAN
jgi:hypothetical protein